MIIFFAEGRLGNQLFEYSFLQTIKKKGEVLLTSGLEEVKKYFDHDNFTNISRSVRFTRILMYEILKRIISLLSSYKVISTLSVVREVVNGLDRETSKLQLENGLINNIKYVKTGYFQSNTFFSSKITKHLNLKKVYVEQAKKIISNLPSNSYLVFVHIRRGDYRQFTMSGKSTYLPISYYKSCITWFLSHKKNPYFIFLSDEPKSIEDDFREIKNKIISYNNPGVDLGIMRLCSGAILSPSSFSWWGSYLMTNRDVVFAPKHWLGFNFGVEGHKGSTPTYAKVIKI
ncbi:MAG: alpha-1,2-fucosyltransferase [bacterium]